MVCGFEEAYVLDGRTVAEDGEGGRMRDWTDEEWDEYIKEVNAAYWAEEEEMKLGIHPSQTDRRAEE